MLQVPEINWKKKIDCESQFVIEMDENENIFRGMPEFIVINTPQAQDVSFPGTSTGTGINMLGPDCTKPAEHIDLYSKYAKNIGTIEIKTLKMLWVKIAEEFKKLGINVTPSNCLNRWKVLERNYKKFIDNQNKTGRGRKYFEYEEEIGEIFVKKKNVHPELLLGAETRDQLTEDIREQSYPEEKSKKEQENKTPSKENINKSQVLEKKLSSIEKLRLDRKEYCTAKLEVERQKLAEIRRRNDLIEQRNLLVQERNKILREKKMCNCNNF